MLLQNRIWGHLFCIYHHRPRIVERSRQHRQQYRPHPSRRESTMTPRFPLQVRQLTFSQGITPTLTIVQVGLGRAVYEIRGEDAISSFEADKNAQKGSYPDTTSCESVPSRSGDRPGSHASTVVEHEQTR
jgi:hypothetical protein